MKIQKGEAGYLNARKKQLILIMAIYVVGIALLLIIGYLQTKTRLNLFTLAAVLICLPACRTLVNLIMVFPHHSIEENVKSEIDEKTAYLRVIYDLVVTSEKSAMPIQTFAISNNTAIGYTKSFKVNKTYAAEHIKKILEQNGLEKVTVKVFRDYSAFLSRAEGMNSMASIDQNDLERAEQIESLILDISL